MADNSIRTLNGASPRLGIGETSIDPSGSVSMGFHVAGASGSFYTFRASDQTQYQVPVGKKLIITGGWLYANAVNMNFEVGYADTPTNNGTPSNAAYPTPGASGSDGVVITAGQQGPNTVPMYFEVPAGKYPFVQGNGNNWTGVMAAFEVDV